MHRLLTSTAVTAAWFLLLAIAPASVAQSVTLSEAQQREFLSTAKVTANRPIGKGITGSLRLTLTDGRLTHDAAFQSIEDRASTEDLRQGRRRAGELNFVDSYKYNVGAYEIARLVGLAYMMPATVERRWNGRVGSLTWWVDDVLMDEAAREEKNVQPPAALDFVRQRGRMNVFAELVRDVDRNKGNILYTKDWRVIMIDFTRAFRLDRQLRYPDQLTQCDRQLFARLKALTEAEVRAAAKDILTSQEIAGVMARRKLIVDRFERLISERGEAAVLY